MRNERARSSYPASWYIEDNEPVGQEPDHQEDEFNMQSTLLAWRKRANQEHLLIGCEMACRWDSKHPKVGVDPDVYVVDRPPARNEKGYIGSLRTWAHGNHPPLLAIEIVSKSRPGKDYKDSPEKHDLLGTFELWIFDPHLYGYTEEQSPVLLQVFQRETNDALVQKYAGAGPYRSDALEAWVMVINGDLVIANDRAGTDRWPTLEEAERRRADEHAKRADEERAAKEEALLRANEETKRANDEAQRANDEAQRAAAAVARIAELEALLAKRG
jgi:Uma2 family endonuclease